MLLKFSSLALFASVALAVPTYNTSFEQETRSLDEIYQAALAEGGVVTLWHGGDEKNQQNGLKSAFEARFPNMTLNVTVDLSKYHDVNLDLQLAEDNVYVDSIVLQTLHDYPRWKKEGALLNYAPLNFDKVSPEFKDKDAAYCGLLIFSWGIAANLNKTSTKPTSYADFTKPEYKDKIALTYPNDDDAVLYQFDLILEELGMEWFEALLKNNPRWVRGTATPRTLIKAANTTSAVSFAGGFSLTDNPPLTYAIGTDAKFVSWAQTGAILKKAPHPEGAKLLHSFMLSDEYQGSSGWSPRGDIAAPAGGEKILEQPGTDAPAFATWMADRGHVERRRDFYELRIGTAQGLSPLIDDFLGNISWLSSASSANAVCIEFQGQ
ncbi:ABC-type Fe3+ transport system [Stemphylium lycopersici]|nr:ABC-type Fe3+ transport system [Stemphylium lycopersici]